jgi:hypothetical protein
MACYAAPGEEFTFYEIDPLVERIARGSVPFHISLSSNARPARYSVMAFIRASAALRMIDGLAKQP